MILLLLSCGLSPTGPGEASDNSTGNRQYHRQFWNFGYLPQKSEVSHLFYLVNRSDSPLSVTKIKAGCSCTSVSSIDAPIGPGDSAAILVIFKSGRYQGRVTKATKVYTDDPKTPEHHLQIMADVLKGGEKAGDIRLTPPKLTLSIGKQAERSSSDTVEVFNDSPGPASVGVLSLPQQLHDRLEVPDSLAAGSKAHLFVQAGGDPLSDAKEGMSITLRLVGTDTTVVSIPIEIKD